jgi:hypothetical protein
LLEAERPILVAELPYNRVKSMPPAFGPLTFDINFDSVPPASRGNHHQSRHDRTRSGRLRYQLVVDGKYYSVRRAQQVTKEVSYAKLNEMPAVDIARYLGKRVVRRLKRTIGH